MKPVAGVVLAAGRSTRYRAAGGAAPSKLVALLQGEALVRHVARAALAASLDPVIVVTGHAGDDVRAVLAGLPVRFVHNRDYAEGLATSLRSGLAALPDNVDGALVLLGDMPLVGAATLQALVEEARRTPEADAVVPVYRGTRGNPVLLNRSLFAAAARLEGDEGARRLLRDPSLRIAEREITDEAVSLDIDDPAALSLAERG